MATRTVSVGLRLLIGDYVGAAQKASESTDKLGDAGEKAGRRHKQGMQAITGGAALAGAAGALALGKIVSASMDFDKAMSGVGAVSDATAGQLEQLRGAAMKAGADTAFSATEAAEAEAELAKAGVSTSDILSGALRGSLDLAAAGQLDLGNAAGIAANAMNIFGLEGSQVGHIADVLAAGANKSAADVDGLAQAMSQGGQVASSLGLGLEDTVGVLAMFADAGLKGSDAGTSLKTTLQMLAAPSGEARDLMKDLGLNAFDAAGNFVGLENFAGQLQTRLGGLTQEQRASALATIFGADAVRAANILYKEGASGVAEYTAAVDDQGAAGRMAAKQLDNLAGDVEALGGSLETALIKSGSGATSALRGITQGATGAVNAFGDMPGPLQMTAVGLVAAGTATAGLIAGLGTVVPKVRSGREALREMGTAGERADKVLGRVGKAAGFAAGAFVAYEVAAIAVGQLQDALVDTAPAVEQLTSALLQARTAGDVTKALALDAEGLGDAIREVAAPDTEAKLRKFFAAPFGDSRVYREAKGNLDSVDQALAQLVGSGHGDEAARQFALISASAQAGGATVDQLKQALPGYAEALAKVGNDATLAADGQKKAGDAAADGAPPMSAMERAAGALGVQFEKSTTWADLLKGAIDRLNGASLSALDTDIAFRDSLVRVTEAVKDNGKNVDINSAKGRANLATISDAIKAASTHAQAIADQTGSVDKGSAAFGAHIRQLRATAVAAGLPKAAVDKLIATYGKVPKKVETGVSAPGAKQSKADIDKHNAAAGKVPKSRATQVSAPGADTVAGKMNRVTQAANGIPERETVMVTANTGSAVSRIQGIVRALAGLHDRTVTVNVVRAGQLNPAGGYASGTDDAAAGWHWVGESGPELMRFSGGEQVLDAGRSAALMAAPSRTLSPAPAGTDPAAGIAAELGRLRTALAAGRGPLVHIERNVMQDRVDVDLLAGQLAFAEHAGVFT